MAAELIDGKAQAAAMRIAVAARGAAFAQESGRPPGLAVVLVGDDPASAVYVASKARAATACGLASFEHRMPSHTAESELLALIAALNADDRVDGILVQLPLPPQIDRLRVLEAIAPEKDVDGFHPTNMGRLAVGQPTLAPCTPLGVMHLLRSVVPDLRGLDATVIGRSTIVGKPLGLLMGDAGCTVSAAQLGTRDTRALCREADIVVAAAGHPGLVRADWIKPGAVVIDVGINRVEGPDGARLVGDVAFDEVRERCAFITPVPGGVGPMTIACLLGNTVTAAAARRERSRRDVAACHFGGQGARSSGSAAA